MTESKYISGLKDLLLNKGTMCFTDPVTVKKSPHSFPHKITRAALRKDGFVYYHDEQTGAWNRVDVYSDQDVVLSIIQRLKLIADKNVFITQDKV